MPDKREHIKQIFRVVCVVWDLAAALENWKRMVKFDESSIEIFTVGEENRGFYKGEEISCPLKYADFDLGGVEMRLVEPLNKDGGDPYSDSLKKRGAGFHHLGIYSEDRSALIEKYEKLGIKPVYTEKSGEKPYMLYDFEDRTGLSVSPAFDMTGPCAR